MLFNKKEKQETPKSHKQKAERKAKDLAGRLEDQRANVKAAIPGELKQPNTQPVLKEEKSESRPARVNRTKKQEPISVIDTWTGEDMIKGIILSEVLGPPKSKRKK